MPSRPGPPEWPAPQPGRPPSLPGSAAVRAAAPSPAATGWAVLEKAHQDLLRLVGRRRKRQRAAAGTNFDDSAVLKNLHRFANDDPADLKLFGKIRFLGHQLSWLRILFRNHSLQLGDDLA